MKKKVLICTLRIILVGVILFIGLNLFDEKSLPQIDTILQNSPAVSENIGRSFLLLDSVGHMRKLNPKGEEACLFWKSYIAKAQFDEYRNAFKDCMDLTVQEIKNIQVVLGIGDFLASEVNFKEMASAANDFRKSVRLEMIRLNFLLHEKKEKDFLHEYKALRSLMINSLDHQELLIQSMITLTGLKTLKKFYESAVVDVPNLKKFESEIESIAIKKSYEEIKALTLEGEMKFVALALNEPIGWDILAPTNINQVYPETIKWTKHFDFLMPLFFQYHRTLNLYYQMSRGEPVHHFPLQNIVGQKIVDIFVPGMSERFDKMKALIQEISLSVDKTEKI